MKIVITVVFVTLLVVLGAFLFLILLEEAIGLRRIILFFTTYGHEQPKYCILKHDGNWFLTKSDEEGDYSSLFKRFANEESWEEYHSGSTFIEEKGLNYKNLHAFESERQAAQAAARIDENHVTKARGVPEAYNPFKKAVSFYKAVEKPDVAASRANLFLKHEKQFIGKRRGRKHLFDGYVVNRDSVRKEADPMEFTKMSSFKVVNENINTTTAIYWTHGAESYRIV